jgi:hypothetical protein
MKPSLRIIIFCATGLCGFLAISCTATTDRQAMKPVGASASSKTGASVEALVSGGGALSPAQGPGITNEDFKAALESSLVQSGLFKSAARGGYRLDAVISRIDQPMMGFNMTVVMDVGYTLHRGNSVVWRKNIQSKYTAPVGEAFAGWVRLRKATEGAARENISTLIRELDEKRL